MTRHFFLPVLAAPLFVACVLIFWAHPAAAEPMPVFVSILPQKYFAERLGGKHVEVSVMVQPGASPATYEPKPRQMAKLGDAKLYFAVGVPFESAWLERFASANPAMRVIHTDEGIQKHTLPRHVHHEEEGRHHAHEDHEGVPDPHVWLAPPLVKTMAETMARALSEADPGNAADYAANLESFLAELEELDARIREILSGVTAPRNKFMVFHPSWGYFARAYGLEQIAIEVEGKAPSPAELQEIIELAGHEKVSVVFVQPQFSSKSAELVAGAIGGVVEPLDPLAEDWSGNLVHAASTLAKATEGR